MTTLAINVEPMSPAIGARIRGIDWREEVDEATARAVHDAFVRYHVLCFPDQKITPQDQVRFAGIFGPPDARYRPRSGESLDAARTRGVMLVSNIRKDGVPIGSLPDGEMMFHSDGAHRNPPYRATTLFAIKIPSRGGETLFANLQAAYAALDEETKARIDGLQVRNIYNYDQTDREGTREDDPNNSVGTHALVKAHPDSGVKSLYLSRLMTRYVVGMDRAESDALLDRLFDHIERPEFVHAHAWTPGDLVIWDNRCTNHARNDFPAEPRLLRRYTISEPA
ncbi:MAG: TauD/TfdA family dioxygenase [Alphaproteobacteria bacterium]|nr:TauD/TfdA family dioxygenase [Alphaproteobacteria bacterium]